jgi:hypothetical protein
LLNEGIPFHNPYRYRRGDWNPLRFGSANRLSGRDILVEFLSESEKDPPYWTVQQFVKWARDIRVGSQGLIYKKGKTGLKALEAAISDNSEGLHTCREVIGQILAPEAVSAALKRDISWLQENIKKKRLIGLKYPVQVFEKQGKDALMERPRLIIGTIHSVKGGESDVVYLFPDLSAQGLKEICQSPEGRDSALRMYYVGMTRAREELVMVPSRTHTGDIVL